MVLTYADPFLPICCIWFKEHKHTDYWWCQSGECFSLGFGGSEELINVAI